MNVLEMIRGSLAQGYDYLIGSHIFAKLECEFESQEKKIQELEKQLAESVPKSEIQNIIANNVTSSNMVDDLNALITPPAKEDES